MSSDVDYDSIYKRLATIIVPIQFVLGILTNIFNILVLSQGALLQTSACTHYFLAITVISILYIIIGSGFYFAETYFMFKLNNTLVGCKLLPYIFTLMSSYISMLFTLATLDRFCLSSTSVRVRNWSSIIIARRAIIITPIILSIILSPTFIIWYINEDYGGICLSYSDTAATIFTIIVAIITDCVPPLVMIIFGPLTILNIYTQRNRVIPVVSVDVNRQRRTEMQLARMLSWQVLNYLIFFIPIGLIYTLVVINSSMQTVFFGFILNISQLWNRFFYVTPFFLYILTASVYRRELIRIIRCRNNLFPETQTVIGTITMVRRGRDSTIDRTNNDFD